MEPIRYTSTRSDGEGVSFEEALLRGLAPDGGLYVPDRVPTLDLRTAAQAQAFPTMAQGILSSWLADEVAPEALRALTDDAFNFAVPVVPLEGAGWGGVSVLELFHGPTLSFKDFGARTMARLMRYFLARRGGRLVVLVATSGDTGSAVADGFAGQDNIDVVLLYPKGQVSDVQERQLIVARPGVRAFAVEGTFDDCQRMVKAAFVDPTLEGVPLSSANSINIGRLLPQMLYYVWAATRRGEAGVTFCVPSGNLGNVTGGVLAALGGLPVHRFLAAHNANDFFPRVLAGEEARMGASVRTYANAMDVGAPSNYERLDTLFPEAKLRERFWGTSVSDEDTLACMRRVHEEAGYVADPHTAVGLEAARRYRAESGDEGPIIVLSTAHPAKFGDVVEAATGVAPEVPERLARLWDEPTGVEPLPPSDEALRSVLASYA